MSNQPMCPRCRELEGEVARLTQQFASAQDVVAALMDKMPSLIERAGVAEARADRLTTAAQAARDALKIASANLDGVCMDMSRSPILETRLGDWQLIQAADTRIDAALASLASVLDGGVDGA